MDTIFAEATPPGRGGVSVIRLSGPLSHKTLESLAGPVSTPRKSYLRAIHHGADLIDQALVVWFEEGKSFTGEEIVEFHLHGAPVIVNRLSEALLTHGLRRAEAGEFTRRAFLNGRIDLTEAEGLADLLSAETEAQRKMAMQATDGALGRKSEALRAALIRAGALIESSIDFADEEVPEEVPSEVFSLIAQVRDEIDNLLARYPATERLRQGYEVAIIGPPNAGKSTLLNHIAKREIALVSDIAGTTRDILELRTDLRGLPVTFLDTAGIRESDDMIESMGVARALQRAQDADLRIHLSESGQDSEMDDSENIHVRSKADLGHSSGISLSAHTGEGVAELLEMVYDRLRLKVANSGLVGHKRQAEALLRAKNALDVSLDIPPEFLAESLRQASQSLAEMVGRVGAEDYLDEIFTSFCIGK